MWSPQLNNFSPNLKKYKNSLWKFVRYFLIWSVHSYSNPLLCSSFTVSDSGILFSRQFLENRKLGGLESFSELELVFSYVCNFLYSLCSWLFIPEIQSKYILVENPLLANPLHNRLPNIILGNSIFTS